MAAVSNYYDEYLKILNSGAKENNSGIHIPADASGQSRMVAGDQSIYNSHEYRRQGKQFGLRSQRYQGRCFRCHGKGHIRRNCPRNGRLEIETLRRERDYFCSQLQFYMSLTSSLQEDKCKLEERVALENMQIFSVMHNSAILQNQILWEISQLKTSMPCNNPEVSATVKFNGSTTSNIPQEIVEPPQPDVGSPLVDIMADDIEEPEIPTLKPVNDPACILPVADSVKVGELPTRGPGLALIEERPTPELVKPSSSTFPTVKLHKSSVSNSLTSGPDMVLSSASYNPLSEQKAEEWEEWNRNMKHIIEAEKREARNRPLETSGKKVDPAALERATITAAARNYVRNQKLALNEAELHKSCGGSRLTSGPDLALASVSTKPDPNLALNSPNDEPQKPVGNGCYKQHATKKKARKKKPREKSQPLVHSLGWY